MSFQILWRTITFLSINTSFRRPEVSHAFYISSLVHTCKFISHISLQVKFYDVALWLMSYQFIDVFIYFHCSYLVAYKFMYNV
jgi:hypothetical protein